jgi:two-component system, response regulator
VGSALSPDGPGAPVGDHSLEIDSSVVIVLVDDNEDDQNLALKALARAGLTNEVVVLGDGLEALQYFEAAALTESEAQRTYLVLLDLNMPRLGGIEVLRRLRSAPSTHNLVIVVLTSSDEERDLLESYNVGANSYVRKPVDFVQFTAAINQLSSYWLSLNRPPPGGLTPRAKQTERVG